MSGGVFLNCNVHVLVAVTALSRIFLRPPGRAAFSGMVIRLDAQVLFMIASYLVQVVTNIFHFLRQLHLELVYVLEPHCKASLITCQAVSQLKEMQGVARQAQSPS